MTERVAIVEFYTWHTECLPQQIEYWAQHSNEVWLYVNKRIADRVEFSHSNVILIAMDFDHFAGLLKLHRAIRKNNIKQVIFNTASGSKMLQFCLLPRWRNTRFVGILHNAKKLETSLGQKFISHRLIEHYFVLGAYIVEYVRSLGYSCNYIQAYKSLPPIGHIKPQGERWAIVPGAVQYTRRDYNFLLHLLQRSDFPHNTKVVLLSNINAANGNDFLSNCRAAGVEDKIIYFNSYVPSTLFAQYMNDADFLLALIHADTPFFAEYQTTKVSGTFLLAAAYNKPMLIDKAFASIRGFNFPSVFYADMDECISKMNITSPPTPLRRTKLSE